ncbi:MAG: hypothetical protein OEV31_09795, partial [Gammaproteobacteria bacterium]|nr:hypothetical protein [Gammaproteobacteria bacterium]
TGPMPTPRVYIEYPADASFQDFFCPACGAAILKANEARGDHLCRHVDFLFIEELAEFFAIRPAFREAARARGIALSGIDPTDADEFVGQLAEVKTGSTSVIYHVTTVGMSCCRSIAVTVVIGIDMHPPAD